MLEHLEPVKVMTYFEKLCSIPHGSYNTKAISDYCVAFAKERGLSVSQDDTNNVIIVKEACEGYEAAPTVILQGHLDMVCEKNADVDFDFATEGLRLRVDGDFVYADGTTLGGDDGIAVACALAILDDNTLKHPRIEAVFTTEEEVGMDGALALDMSGLKGKYLINIDSEEEGKILTSCAGGMRSDIRFHMKRETMTGVLVNVAIKGLLGGHSGAEIDKMRANANVLLGRLLFELNKLVNYGVISVCGGAKDNAIPREAFAKLCIPEDSLDTAEQIVAKVSSDICNEFKGSDPDISMTMEKYGEGEADVFSQDSFQRLLFMWFNAPNGIQTMSAQLPGLVESSLNLGVLHTDDSDVVLRYSVRSSVKSLKWVISDKLQYLTEMMGGEYAFEGEYPEWAYKKDSPLRDMASAVYEEMFGNAPKIEAIHAGLECGLFSEKRPDLDMISIGPDIFDIHTPAEHLSISSTQRVYKYLVKMLEAFPEYCK